jgi:hypothetical protein
MVEKTAIATETPMVEKTAIVTETSMIENAAIVMDDFTRSDGEVGRGWLGSSWRISSNKMVNDLILGSEMFANPGCEGTYTSGLAPRWAKNGGTDCTPSEENTIIHGGAAAQKVIGGTTANVGVVPSDVTVTADHYYLFDGWMRNDGPGNVYANRRASRLANIKNTIAPTGGTYQRILSYDQAASSSAESIKANQEGTTSTTWYVDDWSLKELTYESLINARLYGSEDMICGASMTYVHPGEAGVVINLDSLTNPQNYIVAKVRPDGKVINLYTVKNRVATLITGGTIKPVDGGIIEIRKTGTTYKLFYAGRQLGSEATVTDADIIHNRYVGTFCCGASTFNSFYVYPYGYLPEYTPPDYSSYYASEHYTTGQGMVSLRFDDTDVRNYTVIYPLLAARNLKAGFAVVRSMIGYTNCMTLAQLLEMQTAGMEIMCHSMTHEVPPDDWYTFEVETELALVQMREIGLNVCTFVTPGSWTGSDYVINSTDQYGNAVDAFLRRWFKVYTASINASGAFSRTLPRTNIYGTGFSSMGDISLNTFKTYVDKAAVHGYGMDILMHVQHLDEPGYITSADFTAMLDYLATKVSAGKILVKTPTAQLFATPV